MKNEVLKKYMMWVGVLTHIFVCGLCAFIVVASSTASDTAYVENPTATKAESLKTLPKATSRPPTRAPKPTQTETEPTSVCYVEYVFSDGAFSASVYVSVTGENSQYACDYLIGEFGAPRTEENGVVSYLREVDSIPPYSLWCEKEYENGVTMKVFAEYEEFGSAFCEGFDSSATGIQSVNPIRYTYGQYLPTNTMTWLPTKTPEVISTPTQIP